MKSFWAISKGTKIGRKDGFFLRIPEACRKNRTNLHIESWHKILKYSFYLDKDFEYKTSIAIKKGQISTYKRKITQRHNASLDLQIEGTRVKVFLSFFIQILYQKFPKRQKFIKKFDLNILLTFAIKYLKFWLNLSS